MVKAQTPFLDFSIITSSPAQGPLSSSRPGSLQADDGGEVAVERGLETSYEGDEEMTIKAKEGCPKA